MHGRTFTFRDLKHVLGAADISKAGDRKAGLAATDEIMREAARAVLSGLTLQHFFDHPLTNNQGQIDSVMWVNYDIDHATFATIAHLTFGELKDDLLKSTGAHIRQIGAALTGVMVAALTKLLDVHELVLLAKKLKTGASAKARTVVGLPGTLSSRLQPNHPTDNLSGMTMLLYTGLSMGSGDAILGLNPAIDNVANISATLHHLDKIRRETGAPTQICVLSHIKTQLACLKEGAPVEIMFQSLAGTERTLTDEFDVTVELLDHAYETMQTSSPLVGIAENFMYFETGQGSELTYNKHEGMDMATTEALCYGLARRYSPFMVNNVTGFIGPETHLDNHEMIYSCLQDHFMGKLMGLAMGMAPCYTLHSQVTIEGQQMATELLTAAGANFFMDVYLGTDRMLAYFDTSGHDDQTLRETYNLRPAPEFLAWAISRGIFIEDADGNVQRGANWGNPKIFCTAEGKFQEGEFQRLQESVPAIYGFENAGARPSNRVARLMKANQAIGREAIYADLRPAEIGDIALRELHTAANNKSEHLNDPTLGAILADSVLKTLKAEYNDVQIVISDGLSAEAIHHNIPNLLPVLLDGLNSRKLNIGQPILAPFGRVKLAESIGDALAAQLIVTLIGERPGGDALASCSMSAYFAYRLNDKVTQKAAADFSGNAEIHYEYSVLSNIYSGGLPSIEAGSVIAEKVFEILQYKAAGNRLENLMQHHLIPH
ncbi:MAG: ethanolamine ammonia-lyase [Bacteroidia bacterium]|nr:ethanolamine ammonia-lyase [Methylotenera sp.]